MGQVEVKQPNDDPRQYGGESLPSKEDVEREENDYADDEARPEELPDLLELRERIDQHGVGLIVIWVVLIAAVVAALFIFVFWDELCAKIMLDALRYGVERLPSL